MNTAQEELMHYGVLGMKWGKRSVGKGVSTAVRANTNRVKEASKMMLNLYAHPTMTTKAVNASKKNDSALTKIRRSQYQTTAEIKDINRRVEAMKAQKVSSLNSKKVAKGEALIKKYGNKYTIIQNKDGSINLKDGNDVWKIT